MRTQVDDNARVNWIPIIISIVGLVLALGDWSYGYYIMLRFCICAGAAYLGFCAKSVQRPFWQWTMWGIAIWFNPILPIHMNRSDWQAVDIIAIIPFLIAGFAIKRKQSPMLWWIVGGLALVFCDLIVWRISRSERGGRGESVNVQETAKETNETHLRIVGENPMQSNGTTDNSSARVESPADNQEQNASQSMMRSEFPRMPKSSRIGLSAGKTREAKAINDQSTTVIAGSFTVGSTKDEVLAVQGTPTEFTDGIWKYGSSSVFFSNGRVTKWDAWPGSPLKARLGDSKN